MQRLAVAAVGAAEQRVAGLTGAEDAENAAAVVAAAAVAVVQAAAVAAVESRQLAESGQLQERTFQTGCCCCCCYH